MQFQSWAGIASSLWLHGMCLLSTCVSSLHFLLPLDTSVWAVTFRPSSLSCRADRQVRMKSLHPWSGSLGRKMTLPWKNLTEVAVQLFSLPLTSWGVSHAPVLVKRQLFACSASLLVWPTFQPGSVRGKENALVLQQSRKKNNFPTLQICQGHFTVEEGRLAP